MATALGAVAKGITDLGQPDPRKQADGKFWPVLTDFKRALVREDAPKDRAYPANTTILRQLDDSLSFDHAEWGAYNQVVRDLIIVGFFWLLRPAEYTHSTTAESRSQAFKFRDIYFTIDGRVYCAPDAPLNDTNDVNRITTATLQFEDQKNAVRGEQVSHRPNSDPTLCPCKALGRIALRLRQWGADPKHPIHVHYNAHAKHQKWYPTKAQHITNALRHAAKAIEETTGIRHTKLSARSLRPGGATALLCANVDSDAIMLLGRWKSDAMFRYLRIQATVHSHEFSQRMLDHGAYTFIPSHFRAGGLPQEAPPAVAALLAHDELYDD